MRGVGRYSRGSWIPSTVSSTPSTTTAAAAARITFGCLDSRSESAAARNQKIARPPTAAAITTITGASTATRSAGSSNAHATASTSPPTKRPDNAAALVLVEFLGFRFSFNAFDFEQRVTAAAVKLGLVEGNDLDEDEASDLVELTADGRIAAPRSGLGLYLVRHWEQLSLVGGESLVYWLRKLVFRGAWLDHWVKDGRLEVAWEDETGEFAYVDPRGDRALLEVAPIPSWHELQFRR